jgi:Preprotein translocase subunit SecB.
MPENVGTLQIQEHGIQLNFLAVKELHFDSTRVPSTIADSEYGEPSFSTGRANYDEKTKTIQVSAKFEMKGTDNVLTLRVEMIAQFRVDEAEFPKEKVNLWADKAAFYVLFPFLREQVYSLAIRVGLKPLTIPMMTVPTFKVEMPTATGPLEMAHS